MTIKAIVGIIIIGLGVVGTYCFSTQIDLSRRVADILIMTTLLASLVVGNYLIVFGREKD